MLAAQRALANAKNTKHDHKGRRQLYKDDIFTEHFVAKMISRYAIPSAILDTLIGMSPQQEV